MKKMGFALLLVNGVLSAQSKPPQLFPPRSTQNSVTKQVLDAVELPLKLNAVPTWKATNCAIALAVKPPVTDPKMAVKAPIADPKMAAKPLIPACAAKP